MKVAISLPDPVFDAAERLAEELNISRSQLYAQALAALIEERSAAAITAKLNDIYSAVPAVLDAELVKAQLASVGHETW